MANKTYDIDKSTWQTFALAYDKDGNKVVLTGTALEVSEYMRLNGYTVPEKPVYECEIVEDSHGE